jgi:hypothetical protein
MGKLKELSLPKTQIWLEYEYGVIFLVLMSVIPVMIN